MRQMRPIKPKVNAVVVGVEVEAVVVVVVVVIAVVVIGVVVVVVIVEVVVVVVVVFVVVAVVVVVAVDVVVAAVVGTVESSSFLSLGFERFEGLKAVIISSNFLSVILKIVLTSSNQRVSFCLNVSSTIFS